MELRVLLPIWERRIKVGVGEKPKNWDLADYVLGNFSREDRKLVDDALERTVKAAELIVQGETDRAMNEFNGGPR